jgi:glycoside hydrolase-like protein
LKIIRLALILPGLILAACQLLMGPPPPTVARAPAVAQPRAIKSGLGIDLPTDASDVLNELKDSRIEFVARYYRSAISHWPPLSASEARRLSAMGLKIVAVFEPYSPDSQYYSYFSGYDDAITAYRQAKAIGQPAGSAIYFAIDFNAQSLEPVDQYFRGVAAGFTAASGGHAEYKVGVYGSGAVCDAVKQAGLAQYSWLSNSTAWSGSLDYDDWNIRQGDPLADLSFNQDSDEAKSEYGGFRLDGYDIAAPDQGSVPGDVAAPRAPPQEEQRLSGTIAPAF